MPPNLGGFFMVRSYYPSECHADYFDFERIEALKPAIEACGISTLSQSPMLGFHKAIAYPTTKIRVNATCRKCPHKVHRMEMKTAISCTILRHTKILIAVGV